MKEAIQQAVKTASTLDEIRDMVIEVFRKAREQNPEVRIGYVAGIIKADGPEYIQANRRRLMKFTEHIRGNIDFLVFSATDVFSDDVYTRLGGLQSVELAGLDFRKLWREILKSGHVTDIFMTPRWEESGGATDEHETAKNLEINIHYVEELDLK